MKHFIMAVIVFTCHALFQFVLHFAHLYLRAEAVFCEDCEPNFKFGSTINKSSIIPVNGRQ